MAFRLRRGVRLGFAILAAVVVGGLVLPSVPVIPVQGASERDWSPESFWFEPWGASGVHKGIDIFAAKGTPVVASSAGVVVFCGRIGLGGNVVLVLSSRWRLFYYAHLDETRAAALGYVSRGEAIGTVGTSGNAAGKPPHLHFSIVSLVPLPWRMTQQSQGWKRMFYLDPGAELSAP